MRTALTIAGSDSSGGAGIQADIKTMTANGVYAMSALTALTAQNTTGVTDIYEVTPEFLEAQLDAVFTDIFPDAVKTGMVSSIPLIEVIAQALSEQPASAEQDEQTAVEQEEQVQTGRLGKPRLGVTVTSMPSTSGMWPLGAYIVAVESGSPAEKAGLKPGDILVEMNGEVITNNDELMNGLDAFKEGDTVKVTVWRPEEVGNAENFEISRQGDYVENIEVGLAMLDNVAQ